MLFSIANDMGQRSSLTVQETDQLRERLDCKLPNTKADGGLKLSRHHLLFTNICPNAFRYVRTCREQLSYGTAFPAGIENPTQPSPAGTMATMLKAYMDESGVHDGSPVLTVAAYIARPGQWREWTKKWNVAKRPIKVVHAADVANLTGELKGWTEAQAAALAVKLLPIIAEADFPGVVIGIHMEEFRKAMAGRDDLRRIFGSPYAACFQWVVQVILNIQAEHGSNQRIAFIHECNDYRREAREGFKWIQAHGNPQGSLISLDFGDKATYVPLQAADILAYEGNKRLRDPDRDERRPWTALKGALIAAHYGRENMAELISRLEKIRDGKIAEIDLGTGWNQGRRAE